jgi:uncharacterized membrane protein
MNASLLYPYTVVLSLSCIGFAWLAERWLASRLTGPFAGAYRDVLRNSRWTASISGAVVAISLFSQIRSPGATVSVAATPWSHLPLLVQIHILMAIAAMAIGPLVLFRRKGDTAHRWLGRSWVLAMYGLAISGVQMWLSGRPNILIVFSVLTSITVTLGLIAIWRRKVEQHVRWMLGSYVGLLAAAVFSLMPGRVVANWVLALF